ncbi:glutamine synthetase III family protein [Salibacter halophilus]|uniref:Glutamine synthetase type III n=1 Tax=Salibacter halophilus TaxID=1803916 RepID=A0A6N6M446_9FLAO|nr:glutamine synthetase III [Salibacter halophilus]KAB1062697.1 glutamine synthetase type III [Salibacter halophilus]
MLRLTALKETFRRRPVEVNAPSTKISDYFGELVFNNETMRQYMSKEAFESVMDSVNRGVKLNRKMANQVASAMKAWAMSKDATHYTHWFQPLTGRTAEKHDAFYTPTEDGRSFETFNGEQLVQQEPDASSFPSGGIRNTFEARGYTAWDPSSPAFIIGQTLCIPTIFVSYTGESLDYKAPLIKSLQAIDKAATDVCQYFDKNISKVTATLGWEQEYFLVDSALFTARPDLVLTGRTLFGHSSSKGQQLDDHYFGSIPDRVTAFMHDFEQESLRLGIPVTTRHNEVAPNQFECAPVFEECNLAVDHNQLLMDVMEKVAHRHNFRVLLHEKPFAGMNGSGKHNNWSLGTNSSKHKNLLAPGKTPKENIRFLTFLVNTIKAVHENADLLRATIASAGNDHRLGANEAPPAILSIFIGSQLTKVLNDLEKSVTGEALTPDEKTELKLNIGKIPQILLDNTDRNRTSPFAFTGNKFEFRAVGSTANCANPMIALNAAVAKQLQDFKGEVDGLIAKGVKKDEAILNILRDYIKVSKPILFEGNGYSDEWVEEAKKRGLNNVIGTAHALDFLIEDKYKDLYERLNIMNHREVDSRYEINLEEYKLKIQIESRVMADMALNHMVPVALKYQKGMVDSVKGLKDIFEADFKKHASDQIAIIEEISSRVKTIRSLVYEMIDERKVANKLNTPKEQAVAYGDKVRPYFDKIRYEVDKLELIIDNNDWPWPKYRELLFTR